MCNNPPITTPDFVVTSSKDCLSRDLAKTIILNGMKHPQLNEVYLGEEGKRLRFFAETGTRPPDNRLYPVDASDCTNDFDLQANVLNNDNFVMLKSGHCLSKDDVNNLNNFNEQLESDPYTRVAFTDDERQLLLKFAMSEEIPSRRVFDTNYMIKMHEYLKDKPTGLTREQRLAKAITLPRRERIKRRYKPQSSPQTPNVRQDSRVI